MAKAYASAVANAPAEEVWARIRDFNTLPDWHPGIAASEIEDGRAGDQVGSVRGLTLADGTQLRERLLSHSDVERSYSYNFETPPFDVDNYHSTIRVTPVTVGDSSFVEWWTTFDCDRDRVGEWQRVFTEEVFGTGLKALAGHWA
jgi:hypothetical protein